ncbi:MAG: hypothetical protein ACI4DY_08435 [Monoglobaceae bacterium]
MDNFAMIARIEALLKEKKIPKMKFYEQIPVTPSAFSLWKKNETAPTKENIKRMADILGTTEQYLMFGGGFDTKKEPTIFTEDDELNEILEACRDRSDLRMLFKLANGATADDVKQAIKIIEALRKND